MARACHTGQDRSNRRNHLLIDFRRIRSWRDPNVNAIPLRAMTHKPPIPFDDLGRGSPVVFLHAFPFDSRMWEPQWQDLTARHRMIVPDLRGFGRAGDRPPHHTLDAHADDIAGLLDALGLGAATLVGVSMGGYVALAFAHKHPQKLAGLVLADTRATPDGDEGRAGRQKAIEAVRSSGVRGFVDELLPKLLAPGTSDETLSELRDIAGSQSPEGVTAALGAMRDRPDFTPYLAKISVPTLVLVGDKDTLTPRSDAEALAKGIPGARLVVVPDAGHLSNYENPESFNRSVMDFLRGK
jgi:3-oxoadipate enol-lactonase